MSGLKTFKKYVFWTFLSFLLGIGYMLLLIGDLPNDENWGGLGFLLKVFYLHGIAWVGLAIGAAIAFVFILIDAFLLTKKLTNTVHKSSIRFAVLLAIAVVIAMVHYLLEKVIDVI